MYFDSFGIEHIPHNTLRKIKDKSNTHNIFRIQSDESIICQFSCITFIEFMISTLVDITSFAMGLKVCAVTAGIKTYKSIIKKKRKSMII